MVENEEVRVNQVECSLTWNKLPSVKEEGEEMKAMWPKFVENLLQINVNLNIRNI